MSPLDWELMAGRGCVSPLIRGMSRWRKLCSPYLFIPFLQPPGQSCTHNRAPPGSASNPGMCSWVWGAISIRALPAPKYGEKSRAHPAPTDRSPTCHLKPSDSAQVCGLSQVQRPPSVGHLGSSGPRLRSGQAGPLALTVRLRGEESTDTSPYITATNSLMPSTPRCPRGAPVASIHSNHHL